MTTIREDIANQMAIDDFTKTVGDFCDEIKKEKPFKYPFRYSGLVRTLQNFHTTTYDEAYAEGYNEAQLIASVRKKAHHAD